MAFVLTSKDLEDGGKLPKEHVFNGMGHAGDNLSPHLSWSGAPQGTQAFVVTCFDPDAPTGSGWWHWIVANVPKHVTELPRGASGRMPSGAIEMRTDFGGTGYGGAAPPNGETHRYIFTVHAVKVTDLGVPPDASGAMVGFMTTMNRLGSASLTVTYV